MRRFLLFFLPVFLVVLALDQGSKVLVEHHFLVESFGTIYVRPPIEVLPVFNFAYVQNRGMAWGLGQGSHVLLAIIGIAAIALGAIFWKKLFGPKTSRIPLGGLLAAGIVGNIIDRLRLGYVVDFFDFHWGLHHFPCFNIADSAICVAVFLLILLSWKHT